MLAIDTNVVVRYLVGDHPAQSAKARKLIDGTDIFVCTTVLLETEWVLRSVYGFESAQIAKTLAAFAGLPRVTLQDAALTARALACIPKGLDFADALHLLQSEGCGEFVSFDKRFVETANRLGEIPVRTL